ncbi:type III PLP-dependent enzyme domain-containing protein [Tessaracoccus defluvii]|nr:hypothetical protein [Tessaracoccus defluvii]
MSETIVTPAFVVDEPALRRQVESFTDAMADVWPGGIVSYSVKTNSLPWVVAWMEPAGVWAEVVSDDEYELATALGHTPERIVFNGPVKSRAALARAIDGGSLINLDSQRELRWATELAAERPAGSVKVGVRVNWNVDAECPGATASGPDGLRFGFHVEGGDLTEALQYLAAGGVEVVGLHLHVTSLSRGIDVYRSAARTAVGVIRDHALRLDYLDIGGGFFGGDNPDFPTPTQYLTAIRDVLVDAVDPAVTRLIIEPGAALIAVPVDFHTSVIDAKQVQDHVIVVTDGSRTNLDTFFRKTGYAHDLITAGEPTATPQVISGFTCLDNDRLMTLVDAPRLREGDQVIYLRVGSYTMAFNPLFINYLPAVYARRDDGRLQLVRRRWTAADYLAGNDWSLS